jgi:hypothetical protein
VFRPQRIGDFLKGNAMLRLDQVRDIIAKFEGNRQKKSTGPAASEPFAATGCPRHGKKSGWDCLNKMN